MTEERKRTATVMGNAADMLAAAQTLEAAEISVNTMNEFALSFGQNMPNHSWSQIGRGKFVRVGTPDPCIWRTKQSAFRFAAWLATMAEMLPDEEGMHTLEQITEAIRNT